MNEIITYSLRGNENFSNQYYKDIATFTDQVLVEADQRARPVISDFQGYLLQTERETLRSEFGAVTGRV